MSTETERLIHILLCEEIGSETIPDVTERVLRRAMPRSRRLGLRIAALAAVAALLAVCALAGWRIADRRYPAPLASGAYKLRDAAEVCRGATLVTDDQPASLTLGGYCQVRLEPKTALRIEGKKGAEEVRLEKGAVRCDVTPGVGAFAVCSRVGTVSVRGPSFSVKLLDNKGAARGGSSGKTVWMLAVAVTAGSVSVDHNGSIATVSAGSQQVFGYPHAARPAQAISPHGTERVTLTGMAKALGNSKRKLDPGVPNATLTVSTGGATAVYYVSGWAGVILAQRADGKKAEVSGVVAETGGRKTIAGRSMDAKIIVVEEKASSAAVADEPPLVGIVKAAATSAEEAATVKVGPAVYKVVKEGNGRKVATDANGKKVEMKGIVQNRRGVRWITVTSCKIVE